MFFGVLVVVIVAVVVVVAFVVVVVVVDFVFVFALFLYYVFESSPFDRLFPGHRVRLKQRGRPPPSLFVKLS